MNAVLAEVLKTQTVVAPSGEVIPLNRTVVPMEEGFFLQKLVKRYQPTVIVEVGLGFGMSSLFIADALNINAHTRYYIVDPFQEQRYQNVGRHNLSTAGFGDILDFRELHSHIALAQLESEGVRADFAFIDGRHVFDAVMADFFHIDKLLNIGGLLVLDDTNIPAIRKVCHYILTNRCYRAVECLKPTWRQMFSRGPNRFRIPQPLEIWRDIRCHLITGSRCVALQKYEEDTRQWFYHRSF